MKFTSKQERATYFPVASTAASWRSFESSAHGAVLADAQREALKVLQPYVSGSQTVCSLNEVNNNDKHRVPLKLQVMPDRLFVFYPDVDCGKRGRGASRFILADPLLAVSNRHLGDFFSEYPVVAARPFEVPTALCIRISEDWVDVQDFFWDVLELVAHASEVLATGATGVARAVKRIITHRRRQLDAFRKIFDGDVIADAIWRSMSLDPVPAWRPELMLGDGDLSVLHTRAIGNV